MSGTRLKSLCTVLVTTYEKEIQNYCHDGNYRPVHVHTFRIVEGILESVEI